MGVATENTESSELLKRISRLLARLSDHGVVASGLLAKSMADPTCGESRDVAAGRALALAVLHSVATVHLCVSRLAGTSPSTATLRNIAAAIARIEADAGGFVSVAESLATKPAMRS